MGGLNLGQLDIVHMYLFGGVKFLHFCNLFDLTRSHIDYELPTLSH